MDFREPFSPIRIGHEELKNRIALAPTGTGAEDDDGGVRERSIATAQDEEKTDD